MTDMGPRLLDWAVVAVCALIVVVSYLLAYG